MPRKRVLDRTVPPILLLAAVAIVGACDTRSVSAYALSTPTVIGVIREVDIGPAYDVDLTLDGGKAVHVDRQTVQELSPIEPSVGFLLLGGSDDHGRWILVVGGNGRSFSLGGRGVEQGDMVVVLPEQRLRPDAGPPRTLLLQKAPSFAGIADDGRYESPRGTFLLDAQGRLTDFMR